MKRTQHGQVTRRGVFKAGAGLAAGVAVARFVGGEAAAADAAMLRFEHQRAVDPKHRILLKGGTIVSMDPKVGDLAKGDVLIEGKKIVAVGADLNAAGAEVIPAADMILVPGFIDCHRHSWEGQLRRINPNSPTLADYMNATHLSFGGPLPAAGPCMSATCSPRSAASTPASPASSIIRIIRAAPRIPTPRSRR